jgi:hypothetical protein
MSERAALVALVKATRAYMKYHEEKFYGGMGMKPTGLWPAIAAAEQVLAASRGDATCPTCKRDRIHMYPQSPMGDIAPDESRCLDPFHVERGSSTSSRTRQDENTRGRTYPVCQTCGGRGQIPFGQWQQGEQPTMRPCPECAPPLTARDRGVCVARGTLVLTRDNFIEVDGRTLHSARGRDIEYLHGQQVELVLRPISPLEAGRRPERPTMSDKQIVRRRVGKITPRLVDEGDELHGWVTDSDAKLLEACVESADLLTSLYYGGPDPETRETQCRGCGQWGKHRDEIEHTYSCPVLAFQTARQALRAGLR